jgi:hypothetical protein
VGLRAGLYTASKRLIFARFDAFMATKSDKTSGEEPHQFGAEVEHFGELLCLHCREMLMDGRKGRSWETKT